MRAYWKEIIIEGRPPGGLKNYSKDQVKLDMSKMRVADENAEDQKMWR